MVQAWSFDLSNHSQQNFPDAFLFHLRKQRLESMQMRHISDVMLRHDVDKDALLLQSPCSLPQHLNVNVPMSEPSTYDDYIVALVFHLINWISCHAKEGLPMLFVNFLITQNFEHGITAIHCIHVRKSKFIELFANQASSCSKVQNLQAWSF